MNRNRASALVLLSLSVVLALMVSSVAANGPDVVINEVLAGNASTNIDPDYTNYSGWIELYNPPGGGAVNLDGYSLSIDQNDPATWPFPPGISIPDGSYLIIWADEENDDLHTNFELDMRGGELSLLGPGATTVDSVVLAGTQMVDISYGRESDGASTWHYFDQPTLGAANIGGLPPEPGEDFPFRAGEPAISPNAGFYPGAQSVSITAEPGATIRYTLDGSRPTTASTEYTGSFNVSDPKVVRARAWLPGKLSSETATATYLVGYESDLAVVSIATDPKHFFDNRIGIYVAGTNGITGRCSSKRVNWNQPWERPSSIELFIEDGSLAFQQDTGIEIQGNCTRTAPQKSLEIKTRRRYGDNDIDYAIFPGNPLDEYRRLILRGGGNNGASQTMFREPFAQELSRETMDLDQQQYRAAAVFINGQYWGLYGIRDKADEALIEQNYGLDGDDGEFDLIEGKSVLIEGDRVEWQAYLAVLNKSLTVPANYQAAVALTDMDNFMDYFIAQLFSANQAWPRGNIRYWRPNTPDGKWRWIFWDLDGGYQLSRVNSNTLSLILRQNEYAAQPLKRMLTNPDFKAAFVQRFASHLAITYKPERTNAFVTDFRDTLQSEMPAHIARWNRPSSMTIWNTEIGNVRQFIDRRPGIVLRHLNTYIGNKGTVEVAVDVAGGSGQVLVAGIEPLAYPFTGSYFRTLPLTLKAIPAAGFRFKEWQETGETNPEITVTLTGALARTAVFEVEPLPLIVINELHYNPADAQGTDEAFEFLELYNADTAAVDLSGFTLEGVTFTFPNGTGIAPGEYLVVAALASTYSGNGYQVFGWTSSALSNGGEGIILRDENGNVVDSVSYDDEGAWTTAPDGTGPSLSLLDPSLDNTLPASWAASTETGGTPGAQNVTP